jgi:hypothetical protein
MPFAAERLRISNRVNGFLSAWGKKSHREVVEYVESKQKAKVATDYDGQSIRDLARLMATTEHKVPEAPTLMRPLPNAERKGSSEGRIVPEDGEGDGGDPSFFF